MTTTIPTCGGSHGGTGLAVVEAMVAQVWLVGHMDESLTCNNKRFEHCRVDCGELVVDQIMVNEMLTRLW